jgi:hypothetical protein
MQTSADEQQLHSEAIARAGHIDFGSEDYLEGLRMVLQSLADDRTNTRLRQIVMGHALDALVGRLHSEAGWKAHPQCLKNPIVAPLIVTGMPRTGTSLLHQLLSNDPQFQWMPNWIAMAPRVRQARSTWESDPVFRASLESLEASFRENPQLRAIHNAEAALPEECIRTMVQSFVTMRFVSTLPLPRYERWFFDRDEVPSYRRFADNLRLIGAREPDKTWLLKNPSHAIGIHSLLKVFPDARIIMTYRDPRDSIASGASMILRSAGASWRKEEVGAHRLRIWAIGAKRLEEARVADPDRFAEVGYDDLLGNPLQVVRQIYQRTGLMLNESVESSMRTWLQNNPQGKHGAHVYSLEQVGLDPHRIDTTLGAYINRYGFAR